MNKLSGLIVLVLLAALSASAQLQRTDTKESLRGLEGVYVIIQLVDEQPEGVSTNSVRSLVTTALADAGIPTHAVPKKLNGDANLSITVDLIKQPQLDAYVFTVETAVTQDVKLTRDPQAKWSSSETWRRTIQGITSPDRMDVVHLALKNCVTAFVNDYRTVNPKPAQ